MQQTLPNPILLTLPRSLALSGVSVWAARLANASAERNIPVALAIHPDPRAARAPEPIIHPAVAIHRAAEPFPDSAANLAPVIDLYNRALDQLLADPRAAAPAIAIPNLLGDSVAACAALTRTRPEDLRILLWSHSDIPYNRRVAAHFEPSITTFLAVSRAIAQDLKRELPERASDIAHIPYGVPVPPSPPNREPLTNRPLRLLYTGRLDHEQKRIAALPRLARILSARNINCELIVLGDGPAASEIQRAAADLPNLTWRRAVAPEQVATYLDRADAFLLPSRYEGLSISMLEALARACPPICAAVRSGAAEAITNNVNGILIESTPDTDPETLAHRFADAIATLDAHKLQSLSRAAWRTARGHYALDTHVNTCLNLFARAAQSPARPWPTDRPAAFTSTGADHPGAAGTGAVPPDGAEKLRALLDALCGRNILIHAAGAHTRELEHVFTGAPVNIVAITDDDPAKWGGKLLGIPVTNPREAHRTTATDVILSSWMHAEDLYRRRNLFESQGLRVHSPYIDPAPAPDTSSEAASSTSIPAAAANNPRRHS